MESEIVIRYRIVGVGMMGREHMTNLSHLRSHGAVLTCVADPHPASQTLALQLSESLSVPSSPPLKESYVALEKAIRSLASFYSKAGPFAALSEEVKTSVLDDLNSAEAYL
ncbi:uncharacterized protein A4U43_C03F32100 [Asparagus officinalis]|uniref:Gfo/Idh/MocA-like oxidoreductase N-terminal domain-containing protein n=2 Tax=Asparagus officinalis TaxID=4686 RepID=A0A5P1FGE3_ASPOF|nr:uncharacterized protein A4U43_C03F32100 [Asparagus officinalis]